MLNFPSLSRSLLPHGPSLEEAKQTVRGSKYVFVESVLWA